jgi:2-keto-3-deoxy-L-fuconate dehydrogenase
MRLKSKVCVVTAAGQGIGAATARAFAREGASVWATDVDAAKLQALAGVAGVQTRRLDVLDKAAIAGLAQETGAADVLFNCAGFVHHGAILDATDDQWRFAFDLNVRSMFWTIQAFLPGMLGKGSGSIINMRRPPP